jgi:hypothetical protein
MASVVVAIAEKFTAGPDVNLVVEIGVYLEPSHQLDVTTPPGCKARKSICFQAPQAVLANCRSDDGLNELEKILASAAKAES